MRVLVIAVVLLAPLLAGCSEAEPEWPGRNLEDQIPDWRHTRLEPNQALEMDFPLRQGDEMPYDWFIMEKIEVPFEIHYHEKSGADVVSYQTSSMEDTGTFKAPTSNTYSFLWKNYSEQQIDVWVQAEGEICYPLDNGQSRCGSILPL